MRSAIIGLIILACLVSYVPEATAWTAKSKIALVVTSSRMLTKQTSTRITEMERDLRDGSSTTAGELKLLIPGADSDAIRAIMQQIQLLQTMRKAGIDPYFVYRLGALGRLVAEATAPMQGADSTYAERYYADLEANMSQVNLATSPRTKVDSAEYMYRLKQQIQLRQGAIINEYQRAGNQKNLDKRHSEDISRTLNAIMDIWDTILQGRASAGGISIEQKQNYIMHTMAYYIDRGQLGEIEAAYKRLKTLGNFSGDEMKKIGDMLYEADFRLRAVEEYLAILERDPQRKDILRRIADYYVDLGKEEFDSGRLENARTQYERAVEVEPLHPEAELQRIAVDKLIKNRAARLALAQENLQKGATFQQEADDKVAVNQYAEALGLLRQAQKTYQAINDEFPLEYQRAITALEAVGKRMAEFNKLLRNSADSLSGTGSSIDMKLMIDHRAVEYRKEMLNNAMNKRYQQEIQTIESQLDFMTNE